MAKPIRILVPLYNFHCEIEIYTISIILPIHIYSLTGHGILASQRNSINHDSVYLFMYRM